MIEFSLGNVSNLEKKTVLKEICTPNDSHIIITKNDELSTIFIVFYCSINYHDVSKNDIVVSELGFSM